VITTTVAAIRSPQHTKLENNDDSFCLQNDKERICDSNSNDNNYLLDNFNLIDRIPNQNDKIISQNAAILSILTISTQEKKQTKALDPSAPIFDFPVQNSTLCVSNNATPRSRSHLQNLTSTPNKTNSVLSNNSAQIQSSPKSKPNIKTTVIVGDSLLQDLDPRVLSDKTNTIKIRTHPGEDLKDLNIKLRSKYQNLLQSSESAIIVCGTNSISNHTVSKCIEEAESIIKTTKLINSRVNLCMVAVPFRGRKLNTGNFEKIAEYNKQLKTLCQKENVEF
ncbi:unnamed protein product, partial [Didymodactylos carnosus]